MKKAIRVLIKAVFMIVTVTGGALALPHDDGGGASDHAHAAIINAGNGSPVAGARFCHQNGQVWELRQSYYQSGVVQVGVVSTHDAKWQCEAQLR